MNTKNKLLPLFLSILISPYGNSFELISGIKQEFGMSFTDEQRAALPVVSSKIREKINNLDDLLSLAFINEVGSPNWYRLYDDLVLYGVNVETKQYLGNWPLTPWEYYTQPTEITEREESWGLSPHTFVNGTKYPVGCLASSPLRYGDVENDGSNELVLVLGNDLVVFSPTQGKITFATWLSLNDWYSLKDGAWYFEGEDGSDIKEPTDPQYESRLIHRRGPMHAHNPGVRGYGKIYIGDFDNDQNKDVLVWQKIYRSRLEQDAVRGFEFLRNNFLHFEQGHNDADALEFVPQTNTAPETIQGWLATKNLTWQKGFPSKSECAGQEGQLIPEMHDPLLNDPDVLK